MASKKVLLAKSNGVILLSHSKNVGTVAKYIANKILSNPTNELLETIYISGLLHDIGKINKRFQDKLEGKKSKGLKFRHNEVGWAFLQQYLYTRLNIDKEIRNAVYWHHGISNKLNSDSSVDIINILTSDEIQDMKDFTIELLGQNSIVSAPKKGENSPSFYDYNDEYYNQQITIVRTCIILADRIVSELEETISVKIDITNNNIYLIDDKLNLILNKSTLYSTPKSPYQPEDRFNKQLEIVNDCGQTTIIKAPAGFGKTMVGVIWSALNNKKTIWVCPRNIVSQSVYDGITKELNALNINNVTVELYISGEVKQRNHNNKGEFNSDIIVTNIDNFETPSIDDRIANRLFLINSANVIFDEYHELVDTAPYFSCFINIMRIRHQDTNCSTLLLSATPISINYKWDGGIGKKTLILPDENNHYPAVHNKKYLLRVTDDLNHDLIGSEAIIFNSILESQRCRSDIKNSFLYHSGFTDTDKELKYKYLVDNYAKKEPKTINKNTVISSKIMQASLDISFHKLYESCLSPESTLQRGGRCDRFGDYTTESVITVFKLKNRNDDFPEYSPSENAVINMFYTKDLMNKWFDELEKYNGQRITLDELYVIYNNHVKKYESERQKYFDLQYRSSLKSLCKIYPVRYNTSGKKSDIITAGSNKLRSTGSEIFYVVKTYKGRNFVGPFTAQIYDTIAKDFNETPKARTQILGSMTTIMKSGNLAVDYSYILDNKSKILLEDIQRCAKRSNTPYIRFDKVYDPKYGRINEDEREKLT